MPRFVFSVQTNFGKLHRTHTRHVKMPRNNTEYYCLYVISYTRFLVFCPYFHVRRIAKYGLTRVVSDAITRLHTFHSTSTRVLGF